MGKSGRPIENFWSKVQKTESCWLWMGSLKPNGYGQQKMSSLSQRAGPQVLREEPLMKTAVIDGITGQDGYYLAHYLLGLNYRVIGIDRRTSLPTDERLRSLRGNPNLVIVHGDVTDLASIQEVARMFTPDEWYHLAAQSHVGHSWETPVSTCEITGIGTLNCLEAIRRFRPECRFYFAGSSEQFGNSIEQDGFLTEGSPMNPESPYAAAKVFGYNITQVYRRSYDLFASCGVLFNHESPIRGDQFVTRKITSTLARIKWGVEDRIQLGNMTACRDWGFAGDYVKAMHAILQHNEPDDFVVATGETHSVREFFDIACKHFELEPEKVLEINEKYMRPKDVQVLLGDSSKAARVLNWRPTTSFERLVQMMCDYDYRSQSPDAAFRIQADRYLF